MLIECQEWGRMNSVGDREDMGRHFYSEDDCLRIVNRGGMLELDDGILLTSELTVLDYFQQVA